MLANVPAVYAFVTRELADLTNTIFSSPPSDWADFQRRLGHAQALMKIQDATKMRREDDDEDKKR